MMTNRIKENIDNKLFNMNLSDDIINNIKNGNQNKDKIKFVTVLPILLICIISVSTVYAVTSLFTMKVNNEEIPQLDKMSIININEVNNAEENNGFKSKKYSSLNELQEELGIKLLSSNLVDAEYHLINYEKIGKGYNSIEVGAYIVGDLTDIVYQDEYSYYSWNSGFEYQTPVDLKIEIISDPSQKEFDTEYLGEYKYLETINSDDGYIVNLLEGKSLGKTEICAIFVANGIRYTLTGHVEIDTMIDIVNSMK